MGEPISLDSRQQTFTRVFASYQQRHLCRLGIVFQASLLTMMGLGWEFQAAIATSVTAATIYDQTTLLAQALDENDVSAEDRKLTVPPAGITMLRQAAELQPTGIAEIYSGTVLNGRVMRFGGFDTHSAAGTRVSTRA